MTDARDRPWRSLFFVSMLAAAMAVGCGRAAESPADSPSLSEDPADGGRLNFRLESGLNTLNPVLRTTAYELDVLGFLFDGLVELDRDLNPTPGLALSWSVSDDGLTYRFLLDPRATWSDGVGVTAKDVVFSLARYKKDSPLMSGYFEDLNLERTRAVDEYTVDVAFDAFHGGQVYTFSIAIIPEHVYGKGNFKRDFNDIVVGNGPYVLVRRDPGREILLERRDDYTGTRPHVRQVLFKVIPNATVAWSALTRGELDSMRISTEQWKLYANDAEARQTVTFHQFYEMAFNFVAWNNRKAPLDSPDVRRALTMGIDRPALVHYIYDGGARLMSGPFVPEQWAFNPAVRPLPYDPEGAARLLETAGWTVGGDGIRSKDGRRLEIELLVSAGDRTSVEQGQIFQDSLRNIGVAINVRSLEATSIFERVLAGRYEGVFLGMTMDLDPDLYGNYHSSQFTPGGSNWVFYSNPAVDELLVAAQKERSFEERRAIYHRLHELLAEDQPVTWLVQPSTRWALHHRVKNVQVAPGLGFFSWKPGPRAWWIPEREQRVRGDGN